MSSLQKFTIFEGPDCSGKSTAAFAFSKQVPANLIHHGPYPGVRKLLPRLYVETMLPMLDGGAGQIWDRCWLSEPVYGMAFRHGENRVGWVNARHLERFALRHGAVVVLCLPPWEAVAAKWQERKGEEYLKTVDQLERVYQAYANSLYFQTSLPVVRYDYTVHGIETLVDAVNLARTGVHPRWDVHTGGAWNAKVVLVGDKFSDLKDEDCNWRLPFASFAGQGSSRWLTEQLTSIECKETDLLWVNADEDLSWLSRRHNEAVVALGKEAAAELTKLKIPHHEVPHPQYFKRFRSHDLDAYDLIDLLTRLLGLSHDDT